MSLALIWTAYQPMRSSVKVMGSGQGEEKFYWGAGRLSAGGPDFLLSCIKGLQSGDV